MNMSIGFFFFFFFLFLLLSLNVLSTLEFLQIIPLAPKQSLMTYNAFKQNSTIKKSSNTKEKHTSIKTKPLLSF